MPQLTPKKQSCCWTFFLFGVPESSLLEDISNSPLDTKNQLIFPYDEEKTSYAITWPSNHQFSNRIEHSIFNPLFEDLRQIENFDIRVLKEKMAGNMKCTVTSTIILFIISMIIGNSINFFLNLY